ncbi:hypothetical protein [Wohlfahrtiimonas larvae]|uniref:SMODS and SLOG-associating 2TM effector domain-containing protein n=1 Tax=Wohlfahrtiimonas larvae TaxID=1157986 RepID=A0ABP9MWI0_9GAMM|nr:hypothetical protein [Wohlfahrtiimonas larvae]
MRTKLIILFLLCCLVVAFISIVILVYNQAGPDSLKIVSFILQLIGVLVPLSIIYKEAFIKIPPFVQREPIEDSKSSFFDLRRDAFSNQEWNQANQHERKILDLKYQIQDLKTEIDTLNYNSKVHQVWFRNIWDNFDYLSDYSPKYKALEQFYPLFFGSILTISGSFLSFWNTELYNFLRLFLN